MLSVEEGGTPILLGEAVTETDVATINITVWKIEGQSNDAIVSGGEGAAAAALQKSINYIIKIADNEDSQTVFGGQYQNGDVLTEGEHEIMLTVPEGFEITSAYATDGSEVVLCGAVCPKEGPARISLIERQSTAIGTRWLADWLRARYGRASCVVIDGRNGVDVLVDRISDVWRVKGSIIRPKASDVIAAVSGLENDVNEKAVTWYSGQEQLSASATGSVKRPISGGYGFGGDDPTPIEAAALALWGARTSKRDPTKKMRIG